MKSEIVACGSIGSTAKDFLIHMTILAHQAKGGKVAMISSATEIGFVAGVRGVKVGEILFSSPDNHKQAREILESLLRSGVCSLIVVEGWSIWKPGDFDTMVEELVQKTGVVLLTVP